jgi:hypothetical protein
MMGASSFGKAVPTKEATLKSAPVNAPIEDPGDGDMTRPTSAGKLQQVVMDFSDRFVTGVWQSLDGYIADEKDVPKQVKAQRLKVTLATASMTIAASKDPRANLLDMAVFISAGKWAVERYWIPDVLGKKASSLRAVYDEMNTEIWAEVDQVLTPAQRTDLRSLIAAWKESGPGPREVMDVRLRNLDGVVLGHFDESASAKGLLASVRRLLGNVDQSLLYGERMMFYLERMPLVLSQQADLTVDRVAERFPIATVNPDFQKWADLANTIPQQIDGIFEAREQFIREELPEIRGSIESFERITTALHGTVDSADSLASKVQKLPFTQQDYAAALNGTAVSLEKLNEIVNGLNRLLDEDAAGKKESNVAQLSRLIDERTDRAMDGIFQRAAWLIAMFFGGLILVLIVARVLFPRSPVTVIEKPAQKPDAG